MIASAANQRIKGLSALLNKSKERKRRGVFAAEGIKMFLEAELEKVVEVYLSESFWHRLEAPIPAQDGRLREVRKRLRVLGAFPPKAGERPVLPEASGGKEACVFEVVEDVLFARISDTQTPQGILAVIRQPHYRLKDMLAGEAPLLLILEDIQDPGNLGSILRTAEGAGVQGVIMSRQTADMFNPKTIRATMGSVYRVPFLYAADLVEAMGELSRRGVCIYGAETEGSEEYYRMDYRRGSAFLIGNESRGLTAEAAAAARAYVRIPMEGRVESLNAGMAAAVLLYEAKRQRMLCMNVQTSNTL